MKTKKYLLSLFVSALYALLSFMVRNQIKGRYPKQLFFFIGVLFIFFSLVIIWKLIKKNVFPVVVVFFNNIKEKFFDLEAKIRKKLGLPPCGYKKNKIKVSRDTYIYVKSERRKNRKKVSQSYKKKKWNELETNSEKIRYLYSEYISWLVNHGVIFYRSLSPKEILNNAEEKNKIPSLIETYENVRYSDKSEKYANENIDRQIEMSKVYLGDKIIKAEKRNDK